MTIYKSRRVNLDPAPWVSHDGWRSAHAHGFDLATMTHGVAFDPRPEFEPTRDPEPYLVNGQRASRGMAEQFARLHATVAKIEWRPRREQFDTPVNTILEFLREHEFTPLTLLESISDTHNYWWTHYPAAEIEHAQRVLARLAILTPTTH